MKAGRPRLEGLTVGLWGRHELYVVSLGALLAHRGAAVRTPTDPSAVTERLDVLLLESPLASELERAASGSSPVIVLEERSSASQPSGWLALGANAALPKNASLADLVRAIDAAVATRPPTPADGLTERQREVLALLADGLDNGEIAARLGISQRTARAHVSGVLERLGVENRTQAAVTAVRKGWIG